MKNNFKSLNLIFLTLFSIERTFAEDLGARFIRSRSDTPISNRHSDLGFRFIRSRSDIPIEDEDLVGYREMDGQIKKDLNRFEDIKQVKKHWELLRSKFIENS